jgi:TolB-like protein/DNA-binding winged helix-turn-helix (wHTH) protein/Tfp pilus assembly protein PilF
VGYRTKSVIIDFGSVGGRLAHNAGQSQMEKRSMPQVARFGIFEVDLQARELHKRGLKVKLQEQPFQVLVALLEHPGEVVRREELRQRIWPSDTFVDFDNGLNGAINRLREALGDLANSPRFVETLPRRGYRFIAPVDKVDSLPEHTGGSHVIAPTNRRWPLAMGGVAAAILLALMLFGLNVADLRDRLLGRTAPRSIQSIAVLPLENLSGDSSQEYFADGMTEALITDLSKIGTLRVISRTSVMHYKGTKRLLPDVARELDIDAVVEGAVLRFGDRVRITVQLIRATPEKHLWAESYDRDLRDILTLQGDVARAIANEVQIRLSPHEQLGLTSRREVNPEAYEAYLKGLYEQKEWTEEANKKSILYFEEAVKKDPTYADAWAGLSGAYASASVAASITGWLPTQVATPKAKQAALRALQLDETLSEPHVSLALLMHGDWAWDAAKKELQRAIALDPNDADAHQLYGYHLTIMGQLDEAIAEMRRALELDPLAGNKHNSLGAALYLASRYDEAFEQFRQTPDPDVNSGQRHRRMAAIYERKGMQKEAQAELLTLLRLARREKLAALVEREYLASGYAEAKKTFLLEDLREAQRNAKHGQLAAFEIAGDYALLGEKDKAIEWLEKAFQQRDHLLIYLKSGDRFESLRDDPRFQDLLRRMKLAT